jgi:hypothetical protein
MLRISSISPGHARSYFIDRSGSQPFILKPGTRRANAIADRVMEHMRNAVGAVAAVYDRRKSHHPAVISRCYSDLPAMR